MSKKTVLSAKLEEEKSTDNFIIKLAKQVDSNTKDIKILKDLSISQLNLQLDLEDSDKFNINANFTRQTTFADRQFLTQLGQDIVGALKAKDVGAFEMKFKK